MCTARIGDRSLLSCLESDLFYTTFDESWFILDDSMPDLEEPLIDESKFINILLNGNCFIGVTLPTTLSDYPTINDWSIAPFYSFIIEFFLSEPFTKLLLSELKIYRKRSKKIFLII